MYTPSDVFGSLISDTEHLFDELQSHRASARNVHGSPSVSLNPSPEFQHGSLRTVQDEKATRKPNAIASTSSQLERFGCSRCQLLVGTYSCLQNSKCIKANPAMYQQFGKVIYFVK